MPDEHEEEEGPGEQMLHMALAEEAQYLLALYRTEIGIEHPWSIQVKICCPGEGFRDEASIAWDAEVWFARLSLSCQLPPDLLRWVLVHELYELKHWKTADATLALLSYVLAGDTTFDRLLKQYQKARNQEIEQEVGQFLGTRRPFHLVGDDNEKRALFPSQTEKKEEKTNE